MDMDDGTDRLAMEDISPDSPEEEDDGSVHSSSSTSDFSSDESDSLDSPMDVGYGTPVLDEDKCATTTTITSPRRQRTVHIVDETEDKSSTDRQGQKTQNPNDNTQTAQVSGADDNLKTTPTRGHIKRQESNSPRIEINIKNDKSFSRVSIDDHVELDFDESEDEDFKRDWRHEKRVTEDKKVESEEEGALESEDEVENTKPQVKITRKIAAEDEEDEDCEEGEIKSSDDDTSSPDEEALDEIENPQYYEDDRIMCRYFQWGNCHFGIHCRFLHPGVNDYNGGGGGFDYRPPPAQPQPDPQYQAPAPVRGPPPAGPPSTATDDWETEDKPKKKAVVKKRSPSPAAAPPSPPTESAWERGLRHAKKMRELAKKRKEKETNFEEKRMNLSVEVAEEGEERERSEPPVPVKKPADQPLRVTRALSEVSDDKENLEVEPNIMPKERKTEPYAEPPFTKQREPDPYYDRNYQDDYYEDHPRRGPDPPEENWGRGQQYDNYHARGDWDHREQDFPPQGQYRGERFDRNYPPPNRGKYEHRGGRGGGRGGGYDYHEPPYGRREPPQGPPPQHQGGPPPRDMSPGKEREYWDRRREEDYKKYNKSSALREGGRGEEPVNRTRGEQWSDPWARVKEQPRRKGSRSRSHSRSKKGRRSYSNSSSSSFTSSSRSRSRSSRSSSSYSSRSSYSSSSSRSRSRSRSRKSKEKGKPVKLHARPPKSAAAVAAAAAAAAASKPVEGPPKSTVTKVAAGAEEKRPGHPAGRPGRESDRDRQPAANRGGPLPPPGAKGSRDRGASSKGSGPPSSGRSGGPSGGRMGGPLHSSRGGPPSGRSSGPPPGSNSRQGGHMSGRSNDHPGHGRSNMGGPPSRSAPDKSTVPSLHSSREGPSQNKGPAHGRLDKASSGLDNTRDNRDSNVRNNRPRGDGMGPGGNRRVGDSRMPSTQQQRRDETRRDDPSLQRSRRDQAAPRKPSPRVTSVERDRRERNTKQLPGRMRPRASRTYSSSSSSRSRSRSHSNSRSRSNSRSYSRSSRGSSVSSSSSSSASSYTSSGSADSSHPHRGGARGGKRDTGPRRAEGERGDRKSAMESSQRERGGPPHPSSQPARREGQGRPERRRDYSRPQPGEPQGRPLSDPYHRTQREGRDDRRGGERAPSDRGGYPSRPTRPTEQPAREDPKGEGQKPAIKLTLKSNDKVTRPVKRSISNGGSDMPPKKGKIEEPEESSRSGRKPTGKSESSDKGDGAGGSSSKNESPTDPKKKSTSSRREELLKQLKAVENAITRKRTKLN